MQYLVVFPTLKSENEILWCYHSNETSSVVLLQGTVYLVCSSNFRVWGWTAVVWPFKLNRAILYVCLLFSFFNISQREIWPFFRKKNWLLALQKQKKRRRFRLITWSRLWQPMNGCNFFQSFFAGFWNKTTLTKECWLFHLPQYFAGWRSLLW